MASHRKEEYVDEEGYEEEEEDDEEAGEISRRMSRFSIDDCSEGEAADAEPSDSDMINVTQMTDLDFEPPDDFDPPPNWAASLPATPDRARPSLWSKDYASETEARWLLGGGRRRRRRRMRERWLERAWERKKNMAELGEDGSNSSNNREGECRVVVRPAGRGGPMCMDMDEVRACRDLGLELPCDWTVELPCGISGIDTSSGGNSPITDPGSWRISSPGDDPKEVKARLKVWAQAVALASASRLAA